MKTGILQTDLQNAGILAVEIHGRDYDAQKITIPSTTTQEQ